MCWQWLTSFLFLFLVQDTSAKNTKDFLKEFEDQAFKIEKIYPSVALGKTPYELYVVKKMAGGQVEDADLILLAVANPHDVKLLIRDDSLIGVSTQVPSLPKKDLGALLLAYAVWM